MTSDESDGEKSKKETEQLSFTINKEHADSFKKRVGNISGSLREMLETWNDVEEDHGIDDDYQRMNEIVLQTHINALAKNISLLENEKERLEEKLEEVQDDDEENEVLVKVELDVEGKGFE